MSNLNELNNNNVNEKLQKLLSEVEKIYYCVNKTENAQRANNKYEATVYYEYLTKLKPLKVQIDKLLYCIFGGTYNHFELRVFLDDITLSLDEKKIVFDFLLRMKEEYDEKTLNKIVSCINEEIYLASIVLCITLYKEIETAIRKCDNIIKTITEFS